MRLLFRSYVLQAKTADESKGELDLYNIVQTIPAAEAFRPLAESACPRVKKYETAMTTGIGFIGAGAMGGPMVRRLCERQFRVRVYDSSQAALERAVGYGAEMAASPADVAERAETERVTLPTPAIVRGVAIGRDGIIPGGGGADSRALTPTGPRG